MSTPADRIRRVLNFAATLFPQSEAQDALAALAELEQKHSATAELSLRPLYAHPLALREPTEEECREIADKFLCAVANAARGVRTGRAMFNAVREVMK